MSFVLASATISGFRSFASSHPQSITFQPSGLHILQGCNGSGKSNVIEAICVALGLASPRPDTTHRHSSVTDECAVVDVVLRSVVGGKRHTVTTRIFRSGERRYRWDDRAVTPKELTKLLHSLKISFSTSSPHFVLHQHNVSTAVTASGKDIVERIAGALGCSGLRAAAKVAAKVVGDAQELLLNAVTSSHPRNEIVAVETQLVAASERLQQIQTALGADTAHRTALTARRREISSLLEKAKAQVASHTTRALAAEEQVMTAKERLRAVTVEEDEITQSIETLRAAVAMVVNTEDVHLIETECPPPPPQIEAAKINADTLRAGIKQHEKQIETLRQRIRTLRKTEPSLLENPYEAEGSLGTLMQWITLKEEKAAMAIEVMAGKSLRSHLCDTSATALCIVEKARRRGTHVTVWPLHELEVPSCAPSPPLESGCVRALSLVDFDDSSPSVGKAVRRALGRYWVAPDDATAMTALRLHHVPCVTYGGNVHSAGRVTGGYRGGNAVGGSLTQAWKAQCEIHSSKAALHRLEESLTRLRTDLSNAEAYQRSYKEWEALCVRIAAAELVRSTPEAVRPAMALRWGRDLKGGQEGPKGKKGDMASLQAEVTKCVEECSRAEASIAPLQDRVRDLSKELAETEAAEEALRDVSPPHSDAEAADAVALVGVLEAELTRLRTATTSAEQQRPRRQNTGGPPVQDESTQRRMELLRKAVEQLERCVEKVNLLHGPLLEKCVTAVTEKWRTTAKAVLPSCKSPFLCYDAKTDSTTYESLSALSGGQRSILCLSLLCAIASCRPSSFYIFDEVDAALDETNQGVLTRLMKEGLRVEGHGAPQIICVSHHSHLQQAAAVSYHVHTNDGHSIVTPL